MLDNLGVHPWEKEYLRDLGKKYMDYANLPIMNEREQLWYKHNELKAERPLIVIEMASFEGDMVPVLKCESYVGKYIESHLNRHIVNHELINDDKVIPKFIPVYWNIKMNQFNLVIEREVAEDSKGRKLGFAEKHPIKDLEKDLDLLKPSTYSVDKGDTYALKASIEEVVGDIIPVKIENQSLQWYPSPSQKVVTLMGLEAMMYSMYDFPEKMHDLYRFLTDDILAFVKWQEEEGLLLLNNSNDYAGAGSYGFTHELPKTDVLATGKVTSKDLWGNLNSQETVGISADMFGEFMYPYYKEISDNFGLTYYGCCEPVQNIWKDYLSKLNGIRKVSISPWCDENIMGEMLKGTDVIYSRKPSPNFIGVGETFDEAGFRQHIEKTLLATKGCHVEFIFRDTYTVTGDKSKPGRAVSIVRELINKI